MRKLKWEILYNESGEPTTLVLEVEGHRFIQTVDKDSLVLKLLLKQEPDGPSSTL